MLSCGPNPKVRIATNHSPPFNYWENGKPVGFAVDVINRAAAISGYTVEWIHATDGPEATFKAGQADLWPFVTDYAQRRKQLILTEPWWRIASILYFRESLNIRNVNDLAGLSLAVTTPMRRFMPNIRFPATTRVGTLTTPESAFEAMCTGKYDVALLDYRIAEEITMNRPAVCPALRIGSLILADTARSFAIGAAPGHESVARHFRSAIDSMADSGEIFDIATNWRLLNRNDSAFTLWLDRSRARNQLLQDLSWVLVVLLGIVLVFAQRFYHARRLAEVSARARSQFLANISHEIRTPMNGILGMTELTLATPLTAEQRDNLTMARNSARGLLEILDDILDFSRIESGKLSLESIPFDLTEVAKRSTQLLALSAEAKGITLSFHLSDHLPGHFIGDPVRLQQILINLVGNAVKFTESGSVRLEIECHPLKDQLYRLEFAVVDSGIGIPLEEQARIFDAFSQADSSTTRKFGGTGLGLSISTQLVRMMGGELKVDSQPGSGSRFFFTISLAAAKPESLPAPASPEPQRPKRPLHVLLAEDNEVNRVLIHRILEKDGHRVTSVTNGRLAVDAFGQDNFDVVLMDVHMPELDGLEATRQLRRLESGLRHTPIIALTALALKGDSDRCLAAGMDAYLSKPLNPADLLALLARFEQRSLNKAT